MGGVRTSFPLGTFEAVSYPTGLNVGASFEVFGPVGAGNAAARVVSAVSANPPGDLAQVVRSQNGLSFWLSGHRYRLRAGDFEQPPRSTDIAIPANEVIELVERAADQNANNVALATLLDRAASEMRTARLGEVRFLLFETRPKFVVAPPIIVPSSDAVKTGVGADEDLTFIEVLFVDEDDQPIPAGRYRLELPDSTIRSGTVSKSGLLSHDRLHPGLCHLTLFGSDPAAAAGTDAPEQKPAIVADAKGPEPEAKDKGPEAELVGAGLLEDAAGAVTDLLVFEAVVTDDTKGLPIAKHKFEARFSDGTVKTGTTDADGRIRIENCPSEECTLKVFFDPETAAAGGAEASAESATAASGTEESTGATGAETAAETDTGATASVETKPIFLRLHMDPAKVAALKEKFRLFSTDGSFSKTEATDRIKGNAYMDLMFDGAPTNLSYSLEISGPGITPYLVFENVPFSSLNGHH